MSPDRACALAFPSLGGRPRAEPWQRDLPGRFTTFGELPSGRPEKTVRGAGGAPHCTSRHPVAAFSRRALEVPHPEGTSTPRLSTRSPPRPTVSTYIYYMLFGVASRR